MINNKKRGLLLLASLLTSILSLVGCIQIFHQPPELPNGIQKEIYETKVPFYVVGSKNTKEGIWFAVPYEDSGRRASYLRAIKGYLGNDNNNLDIPGVGIIVYGVIPKESRFKFLNINNEYTEGGVTGYRVGVEFLTGEYAGRDLAVRNILIFGNTGMSDSEYRRRFYDPKILNDLESKGIEVDLALTPNLEYIRKVDSR